MKIENIQEEDLAQVGAYLMGYKAGFEFALKIAWAYANELLITVDNGNKDAVREFIKEAQLLMTRPEHIIAIAVGVMAIFAAIAFGS